jgi:hypothetical protein
MDDEEVQRLLLESVQDDHSERADRRLLGEIPEPWHGRLTARRLRRWLNASRAIARYNAQLPQDAPVLNFFPMRPQPQAPVSQMLRRLGMRIGFDPRADQPTIAWDGDTWFSTRAARRLPPTAINGRCLDISKSVVDGAWKQASGRSLTVDPRTAKGPIVAKPEDNGRHGGRVVNGPIERPRSGWVYQRLVDWRDGQWVRQQRAVIIGGQIVLVYDKWRAYPDLFFGTVLSLPRAAEQLYTAEERAELITFASLMGMDYGELDILRDPADGELYVVDANRTPSRPHHLPVAYEEMAFAPMTEAFSELIRQGAGRADSAPARSGA